MRQYGPPSSGATTPTSCVGADNPRWVFHFMPTSASWLNAVEGFFSAITRRRIRRGVFKSVAELEDAIRPYIRDHNGGAKPLYGRKPPKKSANNSTVCLHHLNEPVHLPATPGRRSSRATMVTARRSQARCPISLDVRELHLRLAQCFAAFASADGAYLSRAAITP